MRIRITAIVGGLVLVGLLPGALTVSRACGKFPMDILVSGTRLASLNYETCSDPAKAEGYARLARESDEDMHAGQQLSSDTGRIESPFSDVTSFFGLLTTHVQPEYAVIALTAEDGSKRVRVVPLPRQGSANPTIAIAD